MMQRRNNIWTAVFFLLSAQPALSGSFLGPAVDAVLANDSPSRQVSCVLAETGGEVIYSRWPDFDRPVPFGSIVKPFTALAYAEAHGGRFPRVHCSSNSGCWLPSGHGSLDIEEAITFSCNTYFRSLSEQLQHHDIAAVTSRFGLWPPPRSAPPGAYFGLGDEWRLPPAAVIHAYEELVKRAAEPGIARILAGLRRAAQSGTASGVGRALDGPSALAKTGTAPCIHGSGPRNHWTGDGYALVLYPADQPRYTLLVRVHGVPGREAADFAGKILRAVVRGSDLSREIGESPTVLGRIP